MLSRFQNPHTIRSSAFAGVILFSINLLCSSSLLANEYFTKLDTNADGVLSGREVTDLKMFDADKDGELTEKEFSKALEEHSKKSFSSDSELFVGRDGNEDGRLSGTEISGYEHTDTNGDRQIPYEEFLLSMMRQRREMVSKLPSEIKKVATERFEALDITSDGRLTGTEILGATHLDFNRDKRVTQDEYIAGMILDAAGANSDESPKTESRPHELLNLFVNAVNDRDSSRIFQNMRPELLAIVDAPVLDLSLKQLHDSHQTLKPISPDLVQSSPPEANGQFDVVSPVQCDSGEMKLHITIYEDKLLGLKLDSPALLNLDTDIYSQLMTDDETQTKFAEYYSPICKTLIDSIVTSKDDDAALMFHPQIMQSVGRDKFDAVFTAVRASLGKVKSVDLESIGAGQDENGVYMMTIKHRAMGSVGAVLIENKFQFQGMNAALVAISTEPAEAEMDVTPKTAIPQRSPQLKEFVAKQDGVKFLMPGKPVRTFDETQNTATWRLEHPSSQSAFNVQIFTFASGFEDASEEFFTGLNETLLANTGGKIVETAKEQWNGHPAQFIAIQIEGKGVMARFDIIVGPKVYSMQWQSKEINDDLRYGFAEPFLKSFELLEESAAVAPPAAPIAPSDDDLPVAPVTPVP